MCATAAVSARGLAIKNRARRPFSVQARQCNREWFHGPDLCDASVVTDAASVAARCVVGQCGSAPSVSFWRERRWRDKKDGAGVVVELVVGALALLPEPSFGAGLRGGNGGNGLGPREPREPSSSLHSSAC